MTAPGPALATLLPAGAAVAEWWGAPLDADLFPEEAAVVARAGQRRRREFATVRACARDALAQLDRPGSPILPGADGAPRWPLGVRGSMTHCDGYAAAAVCSDGELAAVGIDAEPDDPLPGGVLELVATPAERRALAGRPTTGAPCWDRLLFSAKESVYKAWAPRTGEWLDALEVDVAFDGRAFTAQLGRRGLVVEGESVSTVHGRWRRCRGVLLTAVTVPRRQRGWAGSWLDVASASG